MLLKITSLSAFDKSEVVHYYNNETNEVFNDRFEAIDVAALTGIEKKPYKTCDRVLFPIKKTRSLSKLKIQLGLKCNFNCSYCAQAESRHLSKSDSLGDAESFIASLCREELSIKPGGRIEFWGGEPLVYLKTLKKLIPALRDIYPDTEMHIITNGTLLTYELVDWFIEHRVSLAVSHDAQGYYLRDLVDPLTVTRIKNVWLYANQKFREAGLSFGFNVVITRANCDLLRVYDYFQRHFSPETNFGFEGIVQPSTPCDILSEKDAETLEIHIKYILLYHQEQFKSITDSVNKVLRALATKRPISIVRTRCEAPNSDVLVVDLKGNVISCQNYSHATHKIGELSNYDNILSAQFRHWKHKDIGCKDCVVVQFCKGGCPLQNDENCINDNIFHLAIFKTAWFLLFQADIQKIENFESL